MYKSFPFVNSSIFTIKPRRNVEWQFNDTTLNVNLMIQPTPGKLIQLGPDDTSPKRK